jgi:hypothetical protein
MSWGLMHHLAPLACVLRLPAMRLHPPFQFSPYSATFLMEDRSLLTPCFPSA